MFKKSNNEKLDLSVHLVEVSDRLIELQRQSLCGDQADTFIPEESKACIGSCKTKDGIVVRWYLYFDVGISSEMIS